MEERKPLLSATKFDELFTLREQKNRSDWPETSPGIGSYCCIDPKFGESLCVTPKENVVRAIKESMLSIEYDRIYFQIIFFPEVGVATVYAKYNKILGSRLLAQIDIKSIPRKEET